MARGKMRLETLIKRTQKRYANCKAVRDEYGKWYIVWKGEDLFDEFMLPHTETEYEAWEHGMMTARVEQNFTRTHPLKADTKYVKKMPKEERIKRRKEVNPDAIDRSSLF